MARGTRQSRRRKRIRNHEIVGRRVLQPLESWLRQLHELPVHGNRDLHADHVLVAHLVAFLSPALQGLRHIEEVFNHRAVR